jgi:photosystem II stability/assembly factor-like uncharacterized protein
VQSLVSGSKTIALPFDDKAMVSVDGGATYSVVSVSQYGFERMRFFSAAESPTNTAQWIAGTNKGIFRSTDFGASWTRVNMATPFTVLAVTAVGYKPSGVAFAADFEGRRFCSNNGGANWVALSPQLRAGVNAIRTINGSLYYLTDGAGIFREDATC